MAVLGQPPSHLAGMQHACSTQERARTPGHLVSGDQEAWLKDRLVSLTNTINAISKASHVEADADMRNCAIEAAINGQAIEIIHTLGHEPAYINLRRQ